ncbi:hypothetical protein [Pseudorhizobium pelagicum]|uniref:Uncharacterized protein n=1 Tax=Pseudorhizobium pelagicum TaxID=1509405 RepID=A0A922T9E9_9HYPH|nr:hypothetical protein [Pseudorhizobium pelagicum]KEQ02623.1 hypothetical protein GV68_20465 [Pseudorhizobium pelagicum]KEQ04175.1 hypothetical protein GV67_10820 [Pseudorhizobium pelagicum]
MVAVPIGNGLCLLKPEVTRSGDPPNCLETPEHRSFLRLWQHTALHGDIPIDECLDRRAAQKVSVRQLTQDVLDAFDVLAGCSTFLGSANLLDCKAGRNSKILQAVTSGHAPGGQAGSGNW